MFFLYDYKIWFTRIIPYSNAIGQASIQHTTFNQLNNAKQIFPNLYPFPSRLVLMKYQDPAF